MIYFHVHTVLVMLVTQRNEYVTRKKISYGAFDIPRKGDFRLALRKHAHSNMLKILQPKKENFQIKKNLLFFHIPAQNLDCG